MVYRKKTAPFPNNNCLFIIINYNKLNKIEKIAFILLHNFKQMMKNKNDKRK